MTRVIFLAKTYAVTVLLFLLAKVTFMVFAGSGHGVTAADGLSVLSHGLTLDLSTSLYVVAVPFLCAVASVFVGWPRPLRWLCNGWLLLVSVAMATAFVADTSLYPFWQFKLDATCLQYLETPTEAMASVTLGYIVVRVVLTVAIAAAAFMAYTRPRLQMTASRHRIAETAAAVVCLPLMVIGIRGGLGESTTNIGQVYFSQNQFLNHAAVNPVFSFLSSMEKTASHIPAYKFMDEEERARLMEGLYPTESIDPDTLLRTQRPNVVIILMESCGGIFTEDIGGRSDIMPNLNRLAREGVYFAQMHANSYRTDRGTLCTLSGYPSFPTASVMKMPAKSRLLPGIAKSLHREGYHTSFLYGGDINFTNMRSYLMATGFEHLHWRDDYSAEERRTAKWGVRDDITFGTLGEEVAAMKAGEHYMTGFLTLSSHEPWDVPTHAMEDETANAFNYLDQCIGDFVERVRKMPQWDSLLVVMLPDHGFTHFGVGEDHEEHDHVPMIWIGGAVKGPQRIEQLCNQTDLPATLLGQMGLPHDEYAFSRDVMSRNYTYPFAVHTYNNGITMKDSTGFAVYDLDANRMIVDKSSDGEALIRKGMAIVQTAAERIRNE